MKYGIIVNAGTPTEMVGLAEEAETAGWDGVFYFDAVSIEDLELHDPWVILAAMAVRTTRVTLGLMVAAPTRRRPWVLARQTMSVDQLSGGRLVVPVGLGALDDAAFGNVGEPVGVRERAQILDETLAILDGLWSGEPFAWEGAHYRFGPMKLVPTPIQKPRIPIWTIAIWPRMRTIQRAARWDGAVVQADSAEDLAHVVDAVRAERAAGGREGSFDYVINGKSSATDHAAAADTAAQYERAGATWWIEADWDQPYSVKSVRHRIEAGPPK